MSVGKSIMRLIREVASACFAEKKQRSTCVPIAKQNQSISCVEEVKMADRFKPWPAIVEEIRTQHNGVLGVSIYFAFAGNNICQFSSESEIVAQANSTISMQEAVEKCVENWMLELQARNFAKNPTVQGIEQ